VEGAEEVEGGEEGAGHAEHHRHLFSLLISLHDIVVHSPSFFGG